MVTKALINAKNGKLVATAALAIGSWAGAGARDWWKRRNDKEVVPLIQEGLSPEFDQLKRHYEQKFAELMEANRNLRLELDKKDSSNRRLNYVLAIASFFLGVGAPIALKYWFAIG